MKLRALSTLFTLSLVTPGFAAEAKNCCGDSCIGKEACCGKAVEPMAATAAEIKRHALRGVITGVLPEKSALMVKHEEIPGVMRAMTMMFKVDPATFARVQKGQAITGLMSRQGSDWVLEDVKVVEAKQR